MERCAELIEKLNADYANNASPEQLLVTIQLLQKELSLKVTSVPIRKSSRVAIVMPNSFQTNIFEQKETVESNINISETQLEVVETTPIVEMQTPIETTKKLVLVQEDDEEDEKPEYALQMVVNEVKETEITETALESKAINDGIIFEELPTVAHNEKTVFPLEEQQVSEKKEWNEKLVTESSEIADILTEIPIKDLKKGISLNDKFVFVNELFRGDESMYDRSLKTINNFTIYPEAQFWIERELKTKIGWDTENEIVQHFYQLVKRRFATA